jgi:ABC-2 type transport system ATP-binding protein
LPDADPAVLQHLPGVETVELRGDSVLITSTDSDAVARHLLTATGARDLEITSRGLEDAFISLTSEISDADTSTEGADR